MGSMVQFLLFQIIEPSEKVSQKLLALFVEIYNMETLGRHTLQLNLIIVFWCRSFVVDM